MKTLNLKLWTYLTIFMCIAFSCKNDDDGNPIVQITDPIASFTYDATVLNAGELVNFTDTSVAGSSAITSWNWTFTGATPSSSTLQNPTVTFTSKGEFTATLVVTANDNGSDFVDESVLVIEPCEIYTCEKFLVEVESNVIYGVSDDFHIMNIYMPRGDMRTSKPALLINGGGQYLGSNLSLLAPLAERLASYGFVVATARYRNGVGDGSGNLMRGMVDSKAAVRFLRANASTYGIDSNQIFAGGWSSGAYNALIHTYWQFEDINPPELYAYVTEVMGWIENWEGVQGNEGVSSEVSGVVSIGGAMYGQYEGFQDDLWITSTDVPMFAIHGSEDTVTPCGALDLGGNWEFGSCIVHNRLLDVGISSTLVTIEGGNHESPRLPVNIDVYIEDLVGFLSGN